jgi:hypothetical protein
VYHGVEKEEDGIGDSGGNAGRTGSTSAKGSTLFSLVERPFGAQDTAAAPQQERTHPPMPVIPGTARNGIDNSAPMTLTSNDLQCVIQCTEESGLPGPSAVRFHASDRSLRDGFSMLRKYDDVGQPPLGK